MFVEVLDFGAGFEVLVLVVKLGGGGAGGVPLFAQRREKGGLDEALDVGAGSVVGAELVAFGGVEGAF